MFQDSFLKLATTPYDYRYFALPEFLSAISYMMILVGAIEFLSSQVPYSMKGVIVGLFYTSYVFSLVLNRGILKIFHVAYPRWSTKALFSCGFWYLQSKAILMHVDYYCVHVLIVNCLQEKKERRCPSERTDICRKVLLKKASESIILVDS